MKNDTNVISSRRQIILMTEGFTSVVSRGVNWIGKSDSHRFRFEIFLKKSDPDTSDIRNLRNPKFLIKFGSESESEWLCNFRNFRSQNFRSSPNPFRSDFSDIFRKNSDFIIMFYYLYFSLHCFLFIGCICVSFIIFYI